MTGRIATYVDNYAHYDENLILDGQTGCSSGVFVHGHLPRL